MGTIWTPGGEHVTPDPRREPAPAREQAAAQGMDEPTPEELEAEMAEVQRQLAETPVHLVIANHAIGLFQLAALHLNQRPPNLADGRLAIDAMAALVEGLAGRLGDEEAALRDGLNQARMAFVQLSSSAGGPGAGDGAADAAAPA